MTVGDSLKRFRNEFGLTQKQIADSIKIFPQLYYKYESDKSVPSAEVILKIANAFDVSADYLLGRSDNPKTSEISDADKKLLEVAKAFRGVLQSPATINS